MTRKPHAKQYEVMPFGLCYAPATFEQLMSSTVTSLPCCTLGVEAEHFSTGYVKLIFNPHFNSNAKSVSIARKSVKPGRRKGVKRKPMLTKNLSCRLATKISSVGVDNKLSL